LGFGPVATSSPVLLSQREDLNFEIACLRLCRNIIDESGSPEFATSGVPAHPVYPLVPSDIHSYRIVIALAEDSIQLRIKPSVTPQSLDFRVS
jgi:hypothetical protein